ncbi:hypothetical protein SERLA73DRAFT_150297 [Serpula lacrymans var. lacrymans S7.3]|uniref:Uncharacterized protein n=1 Tax=Serpula lacrymans var. lacrymans (strain S7.3) TaxID=936435 RepID=F8PLY7_SERL3|nr:hypothetical protein SERLA73DRAFT_150297 [Serpula lacrymans var. lacrymans S7.3]
MTWSFLVFRDLNSLNKISQVFLGWRKVVHSITLKIYNSGQRDSVHYQALLFGTGCIEPMLVDVPIHVDLWMNGGADEVPESRRMKGDVLAIIHTGEKTLTILDIGYEYAYAGVITSAIISGIIFGDTFKDSKKTVYAIWE